MQGRGFSGDGEVLVSENYARRSGAALGQALNLDGKAYTIVGILSVEYPEKVDVYVPASAELQRTSRRASFLPTIARMKPGVKLAEIQAQLATVSARLAA